MTTLLTFLLEASICLSILYLLYRGLLAKCTHFGWNRLYLLGILVLSCLFPLLSLPSLWSPPIIFSQGGEFYHNLEEVVVWYNQPSSLVSFPHLLAIVYLLGLVYGIARFIGSLVWFYRITKKAERRKVNGYWVYIHPEFKPASFLNYILMPEYDLDHRTSELVLVHEQNHIKMGHSIDLLVLEFFQILFWFHPLLYLIRKSLKEVHEFQVDKELVKVSSLKEYASLLIEPFAQVRGPSFIHYFNHLQIKNRIIMMTKSQSTPWAKSRYALLLPIVALLTFVFSCEKEAEPTDDVRALSAKPSKTNVFDVVEDMPVPQGGMEGWNRYLQENLHYPPDAREEGIEGTVYAEFVVDESGKIRDVEILRGIDNRLDAEALNVLKNSPNWSPGKHDGKDVNVKMRLPIRFQKSK
ncbi:M56 family metallopeptidase [Pleomorphovibrio marinus]|uniref:M56 family metallopeptidase n=1 Tax=Pleomorphovibrio marinus TaxID=2164132 RepID=UPI000E0C4932|nr:M56 family metallopeptidase [Pleomorphovibrio marinus]